MATDTRQTKQQLTFAELCEAIADEKISYTRRDDEYLLKGSDVRRMERAGEENEISLEFLPDLENFSSSASAAQ